MPKNNNESKKRFDILKQANLFNYLKDLDLNDEFSIYNSIIMHLVDGDFDYDFYSPVLKDCDDDTKKKMGDAVRKYMSLCFFGGNPLLWQDSVDGVSGDLEFSCMRVLDNYNFLYEMIAMQNGEEALKEIVRLKDEFADAGPVVEKLRNSFENDGVLKIVLFEMGKTDGRYVGLNDYQKYSLLNNPKGNLFCYENENTPRIILPDELARKISSRVGLDDKNITLVGVANKLGDEAFAEVIRDITYEELSKNSSNINELKK